MDNANDGGMTKAPEVGQGNFAPNSQQVGAGAERNIDRVNLEPIARPSEVAPDLGNATLAMPDLMATPPEIGRMPGVASEMVPEAGGMPDAPGAGEVPETPETGGMPDVAEILRQEKAKEKNRERAGEGMAMDILEFARNEEMKAEQRGGFVPGKAELGEFIGGAEAEQGKMQGTVKEADLTTLADGGSTEGRKIVSLDGDVMDKESEKMVVKAYNELPLKNLHSWRHEQMRKALKANYNRDFGEERAA